MIFSTENCDKDFEISDFPESSFAQKFERCISKYPTIFVMKRKVFYEITRAKNHRKSDVL